jgi:hypothetical protein
LPDRKKKKKGRKKEKRCGASYMPGEGIRSTEYKYNTPQQKNKETTLETPSPDRLILDPEHRITQGYVDIPGTAGSPTGELTRCECGEGGLHRGKLNEMDQLFSASGNEWRCATRLEKEVPGKADFDSGTNQIGLRASFSMFLILHDGRLTDLGISRK